MGLFPRSRSRTDLRSLSPQPPSRPPSPPRTPPPPPPPLPTSHSLPMSSSTQTPEHTPSKLEKSTSVSASGGGGILRQLSVLFTGKKKKRPGLEMDQGIGYVAPGDRAGRGRGKNRNHPPPELAFQSDSSREPSLDIRPPSGLGAFGSAPTTPVASPSPHHTTFNPASTSSPIGHAHGAFTSASRPSEDMSESTTSALGVGRSRRRRRSDSDLLARASTPGASISVSAGTSAWPVPPGHARFATASEIVDARVDAARLSPSRDKGKGKAREDVEDGPFRLLDLPVEMLARVLDCLSKHEVFDLLHTSRKIGEAGAKSLYTALDLKVMHRSDPAGAEQMLHRIATYRDLAAHVRWLSLPSAYTDSGSMVAIPAIRNCIHLRTLVMTTFSSAVLGASTFHLRALNLLCPSLADTSTSGSDATSTSSPSAPSLRDLWTLLAARPLLAHLGLPHLCLAPDTVLSPDNDLPPAFAFLPALRSLVGPPALLVALVPGRPIENMQIHLGKACTIVGGLRPSTLAEALGRNAKPDPKVEGEDEVDHSKMTEAEKKEIERKKQEKKAKEAKRRRIKLRSVGVWAADGVDGRTIERVTGALASEMSSTVKHLQVVCSLPEEALYKHLATAMSKFTHLRTLQLSASSDPTSTVLESQPPTPDSPQSFHSTASGPLSTLSPATETIRVQSPSPPSLEVPGVAGRSTSGDTTAPSTVASSSVPLPSVTSMPSSPLSSTLTGLAPAHVGALRQWTKHARKLHRVVFPSGAEWQLVRIKAPPNSRAGSAVWGRGRVKGPMMHLKDGGKGPADAAEMQGTGNGKPGLGQLREDGEEGEDLLLSARTGRRAREASKERSRERSLERAREREGRRSIDRERSGQKEPPVPPLDLPAEHANARPQPSAQVPLGAPIMERELSSPGQSTTRSLSRGPMGSIRRKPVPSISFRSAPSSPIDESGRTMQPERSATDGDLDGVNTAPSSSFAPTSPMRTSSQTRAHEAKLPTPPPEVEDPLVPPGLSLPAGFAGPQLTLDIDVPPASSSTILKTPTATSADRTSPAARRRRSLLQKRRPQVEVAPLVPHRRDENGEGHADGEEGHNEVGRAY